MSGGLCWTLCLFFLPETRGDVILTKRAKALQKSTGQPYFVFGLDVHESFGQALKVSLSRPLLYLVRPLSSLVYSLALFPDVWFL